MGTTVRSLITITAELPEPATSLVDRVIENHLNMGYGSLAKRLSHLFNADLVMKGGKLGVRIDQSTTVQASLTVTCTQADFTAGDKLVVHTPTGEAIVFTAKASGAVAANGEFNAVTDDNTTAANLRAAVVAYPLAVRWLESSVATNVVTLKPVMSGAGGNAYPKVKVIVTSGTPMALSNSGSFTAGKDAYEQASLTNTITHASLVDNTDTLVFGAVVTLTWKTTPSGENEVAIGADSTAAAVNLVAKINAHSKLTKLFVATNSAGVVTITFKGDPRLGAIIGLTESGNGQVLSAANFAPGATLAAKSDAVIVASGGAG